MQRVKSLSEIKEVFVTNTGDKEVVIENIRFSDSSNPDFEFTTDPNIALPATIQSNETHSIFVRFSPQTEGEKSIYIIVTDENDTEVQGELTGAGTLPQIYAEDKDFGSSDVNQAAPSQSIIISNDSQSEDLFIESIEITGTDASDFVFATTQTTTNLTIPQSGSISVEIIFTPSSSANKLASLDMIHNAVEGDISERVTYSVNLTGTGLASESLSLEPATMGCEIATSILTVHNPTGNSITVDLEIWDDTDNAFSFDENNLVVTKTITVSGEKEDLNVYLIGGGSSNNLSAQITASSQGLENASIIVQAERRDDIAMNITNKGELTEKVFLPNSTFSLQFDSDIFSESSQNDLSDFDLVISINPEQLILPIDARYVSILGNQVPLDSRNGGELIFKLDKGDLSNDKITGEITFNTLLTNIDRDEIITVLEFPSDICLSSTEDRISLNVENCISQFRGGLTFDNTDLERIAPSPVGDMLSLHYSIGIDGIYTEINLYDSFGSLVENIYSGSHEEGYFNRSISTQKMHNGIYFLVFESGSKRTSQNLIILK